MNEQLQAIFDGFGKPGDLLKEAEVELRADGSVHAIEKGSAAP